MMHKIHQTPLRVVLPENVATNPGTNQPDVTQSKNNSGRWVNHANKPKISDSIGIASTSANRFAQDQVGGGDYAHMQEMRLFGKLVKEIRVCQTALDEQIKPFRPDGKEKIPLLQQARQARCLLTKKRQDPIDRLTDLISNASTRTAKKMLQAIKGILNAKSTSEPQPWIGSALKALNKRMTIGQTKLTALACRINGVPTPMDKFETVISEAMGYQAELNLANDLSVFKHMSVPDYDEVVVLAQIEYAANSLRKRIEKAGPELAFKMLGKIVTQLDDKNTSKPAAWAIEPLDVCRSRSLITEYEHDVFIRKVFPDGTLLEQFKELFREGIREQAKYNEQVNQFWPNKENRTLTVGEEKLIEQMVQPLNALVAPLVKLVENFDAYEAGSTLSFLYYLNGSSFAENTWYHEVYQALTNKVNAVDHK